MRKRSLVNWSVGLLFIAVSLIGCEQKQQLRKPISESASGSFPIMAWNGPTAGQLDIAHFRQLADAGFTVDFSYLGTYELNKKALQLAQQVGVKLIISDNRIQPDKPVGRSELQEIDQVVRDYKSFPALLGYFVKDEPGASIFNNIAAIKHEIILRDPAHVVYVNLFPDDAGLRYVGTKTYQEYINRYIQIVRPKFFSYDNYPFLSSGFKPGYYHNMEVIRSAAQKAGIPFWAFTMSCQLYPPYPAPKESWVRLQLYSDLAYGARGLIYYAYALPISGFNIAHVFEDYRTSILDSTGKPTYIYSIAKRVNLEIQSLGPVIDGLRSVGVYQTKPLPEGTNPLPKDFYVEKVTGGPMVVGYFKDESSQPYLLLVNRNYQKRVNFTLFVSEKVKGLMEISKSHKQGPKVFKVKKGEVELQFDAGDGRLFRILKRNP